MTQQTEKKTYKSGLNLPRTSFSMKANLVQNEPAQLKKWQQANLYDRIRSARAGRPKFVFHDGPPYANGAIHIGHLMNKVLKDMVVRSKTMAGFDCAYVPGWDCHGLPIEHKVLSEQHERNTAAAQPTPFGRGSSGRASADEIIKVRRACKKYAEKYIKLQSQQLQRLLTVADYDHPYLTMSPDYEAAVLEVFAELVGKGLVYRALKPVHWSIANQTALAEAELEYEDRQDTSVYALFDVADAAALPASLSAPQGAATALMIWTTTPWTLPANMAVAVHERYEYGLYKVGEGFAVIATDLAAKVISAAGHDPGDPVGTCRGGELLSTRYHHPFVERTSPVVLAEYVTLEDGTGLVHTAPGHGVDDYHTGIREGIDIYCPVRDDGTFDDSVPDWLHGLDVWQANGVIVEHLRGSGHLFHTHQFTHSYPHDWRSKTPVIFRATEQWFAGVDKPFDDEDSSLRHRALTVTDGDVQFIPEWGRNRMRGMVESRPDWCLSRQRAWGLPIPAFFNENGEVLLTEASVRAVANVVRSQGSDAWFKLSPEQLLKDYNPTNDPDAPAWAKSDIRHSTSEITNSCDIFDVWFESGSSWHAVIRQRFGDEAYPTDLYLEGSDQHRGWFQLSLLPALGVTGRAPFRVVLTHGFMVDKDGRKMSKSQGNALKVEDLLKDFGADVCRWWVSSLNTENDIKVDHKFFELAGEEYRKVRNTLRFILGNLGDFAFDRDKVRFEDDDASSIDAWATKAIIDLSDVVLAAYERFDFRKAHEAIFNFCNDTMSAVYLAAVKDRLYCDRFDSRRRRRTQTTLYRIATTLVRLLAPILPHTVEQAWHALEGDDVESIHLKMFGDVDCMRQIPIDPDWPSLMTRRDQWLKAIEDTRQRRGIDNPLDMGIELTVLLDSLKRFDPIDLADLCGVSRFILVNGADHLEVLDLRDEPRCERSWKRDGSVRQRADGGMLSDRDADAVSL